MLLKFNSPWLDFGQQSACMQITKDFQNLQTNVFSLLFIKVHTPCISSCCLIFISHGPGQQNQVDIQRNIWNCKELVWTVYLLLLNCCLFHTKVLLCVSAETQSSPPLTLVDMHVPKILKAKSYRKVRVCRCYCLPTRQVLLKLLNGKAIKTALYISKYNM